MALLALALTAWSCSTALCFLLQDKHLLNLGFLNPDILAAAMLTPYKWCP